MLLFTLSEDLATITDWISANLGLILPIICSPVVIIGIIKLIMFWITCSKAKKQKIVEELKSVATSNTEVQAKMTQLQDILQKELNTFEGDVIDHIEAKFKELRNKRVEMYNKVADSIEQIETEAVKIAPQKQEDIEAVIDAVENKVEETETQIETHFDGVKRNVEELMR